MPLGSTACTMRWLKPGVCEVRRLLGLHELRPSASAGATSDSPSRNPGASCTWIDPRCRPSGQCAASEAAAPRRELRDVARSRAQRRGAGRRASGLRHAASAGRRQRQAADEHRSDRALAPGSCADSAPQRGDVARPRRTPTEPSSERVGRDQRRRRLATAAKVTSTCAGRRARPDAREGRGDQATHGAKPSPAVARRSTSAACDRVDCTERHDEERAGSRRPSERADRDRRRAAACGRGALEDLAGIADGSMRALRAASRHGGAAPATRGPRPPRARVTAAPLRLRSGDATRPCSQAASSQAALRMAFLGSWQPSLGSPTSTAPVHFWPNTHASVLARRRVTPHDRFSTRTRLRLRHRRSRAPRRPGSRASSPSASRGRSASACWRPARGCHRCANVRVGTASARTPSSPRTTSCWRSGSSKRARSAAFSCAAAAAPAADAAAARRATPGGRAAHPLPISATSLIRGMFQPPGARPMPGLGTLPRRVARPADAGRGRCAG